MQITKTLIPDLLVIKPDVFTDNRGLFYEMYNNKRYTEETLPYHFIQDNVSQSKTGTIRGLHYQLNPYSQAKLVTTICGAILDVVVDLRKNSPTFGKTFAIELSEDNRLQLLIPRGFAHGFSVLQDNTVFYYKCDNLYNKECERGINVFDPSLAIEWGFDKENTIISDKDVILPLLSEAEINFE